MTLADDIKTIKADVAEIKAAPAPVATVDLTEVDTKLDAIKSDTTDIKAELTPTV